MKILRSLLLILLCAAINSLTAQNPTTTSTKGERAPSMSTWFLATGDWDKDPQLFVYEFGTGKDTVVMLHGGWGGEHGLLLDAVRGFEKQYHFVFYDQRGSLRSPCPDSLVTYANLIDDLELLRKELGLNRLTIAGHSMGAVLAGAYASKYPQRVKHLILLSPARLRFPLSPDEEGLANHAWKDAELFMNRAEVAAELNKYNLNRQIGLTSKEHTIKHRIGLAKMMLYDVSNWKFMNDGKPLFKAHLFPLIELTYPKSGWNFIDDFSKEHYKIDLITGDHDFLDFRNPLAKKWAGDLPRINLTIIPKAGHILWIDQPEAFRKAFDAALERR
jgi:proline iminopeptidase